MGMFDSVFVNCPSCGEEQSLEFQSKSGDCELTPYTLANVPPEVLVGIHSYSSTCKKCKKSFSPVVKKTPLVVGYSLVLTEEIPGESEKERIIRELPARIAEQMYPGPIWEKVVEELSVNEAKESQ